MGNAGLDVCNAALEVLPHGLWRGDGSHLSSRKNPAYGPATGKSASVPLRDDGTEDDPASLDRVRERWRCAVSLAQNNEVSAPPGRGEARRGTPSPRLNILDREWLTTVTSERRLVLVTCEIPKSRRLLLLAGAMAVVMMAVASSAQGLGKDTARSDSGLIAFGLGRGGCGGQCDTNSIWTTSSDGAQLNRLTPLSGGSLRPAWSPDDRKIAYENGSEIYEMNADGTGKRRLTRKRRSNYSEEPRWSPDGKRIVYVYDDGGPDKRIRIMNADGTNARAFNFRGYVTVLSSPDWAPDGRRIAFAGSNGVTGPTVYVVNIDGTGLRKIISPIGGLFGVRWSPDGKKLLVVSDVLLIVNSTGGAPRSFPATRYANTASWSPDGRRIVFAASAEPMKILSLRDGSVRTIRAKVAGTFNSVDWQHVPHRR
jgi:WD40 repeat protein